MTHNIIKIETTKNGMIRLDIRGDIDTLVDMMSNAIKKDPDLLMIVQKAIDDLILNSDDFFDINLN